MSTKPIKYILSLIAIITIINLIFIFLFSFLWQSWETNRSLQIVYYFLAALSSAVFVAFFVMGTTPVLKDFLATYRQLLRLENLSHPLLLKLSLEAPGTYHHSLSVANLAHRAAKAIGADPLLTRVGAYYHDIGKTINPEYFIENQRNGDNPHQDLSDPKKSFSFIKKHVAEGLKLVEEYHLPKEVTAFINEHQGTQLSHFYSQALERGYKAKKSDFRYDGPKPLSRETAIVMLADTIEAKIRLLEKVTPQAIRDIVNTTVEEKLAERQLDLSGISNRDLEKIKISFVETLEVIYHHRIDYKDRFRPFQRKQIIVNRNKE